MISVVQAVATVYDRATGSISHLTIHPTTKPGHYVARLWGRWGFNGRDLLGRAV